MRREDPAIRFWRYVLKTGSCWLWTGHLVNARYGRLRAGRMVLAHRFSYELLRGPIPPNMTIDHLCRNTRCVNPDHLEITTQHENVLRGIAPSAVNAHKTHCIRGHAFTTENTAHWRAGRTCRTCTNTAKREAYRLLRLRG